MLSKWTYATAFVGCLGVSACGGGNNSPSLTTPTVAPTTEMFTGTVPIGGADAHNFTIALSNGQVDVTLTAAGPPATIYTGVGVGTPSDAGCTPLSGAVSVGPAGPTAALSGTATAGTYCVVVFDAGNQTTDITYAVTVTHF